jgi:hypothetical protein
MFLRFTVAERDPESRTWQGLFTNLRRARVAAQSAVLSETLDWFSENLPIPPCYGSTRNPRAVCWFRPDAGEPLTRMWRLVSYLESAGIAVQLHKTRDPGRRIYSDQYQVVAEPRAKMRVRTFRLR